MHLCKILSVRLLTRLYTVIARICLFLTTCAHFKQTENKWTVLPSGELGLLLHQCTEPSVGPVVAIFIEELERILHDL